MRDGGGRVTSVKCEDKIKAYENVDCVPYTMERGTDEMALELQAILNISVEEYFHLLTRNLSGVVVPSASYDRSEGLLWVILTPVVYFLVVSLVLTSVLVFYWYTEDPGKHTTRTDNNLAPVEMDTPLGLTRTFLNIDGASQVVTRSSGVSKGSVRSLGTLTDLDQDFPARNFTKIVTPATRSRSCDIQTSKKEDIELIVCPGANPRTGGLNVGPENLSISDHSSRLSDFQVNFPPPLSAEQFKFVWVSGDEVQSDEVLETCRSLVSSGHSVQLLVTHSANKQTNTRDLNLTKRGQDNDLKKRSLREDILRATTRMNKTSDYTDHSDHRTAYEVLATRHYTDPTVRYFTRGSQSPGGSYLDYLRGPDTDNLSHNQSSERDVRKLPACRHLRTFSESDSDDLSNVHQDSDVRMNMSCRPVDLSDYKDLDYFDICDDHLDDMSDVSNLTSASVDHLASASVDHFDSKSTSENFGVDEGSEMSPPLSLPSSISRFHSSKKLVQTTPQSNYPFTASQIQLHDSGRITDSTDTIEVSLVANAGSCSQTGADDQTSRLNSNTFLLKDCYTRSDIISPEIIPANGKMKVKLSYFNSASASGRKFRMSSSEPEVQASLNNKEERKKTRKRFSLDVLNCGRVTVEERLAEFGFLKPTGNKYVINPSPSRFSRRGVHRSPESVDYSDDNQPVTDDEMSGDRGCPDSVCYGSVKQQDELLLNGLHGNKIVVVKRQDGEDNNNNNLLHVHHIRGRDIEGAEDVSQSFHSSKRRNGDDIVCLATGQCVDRNMKQHTGSVEISTEGHLTESIESRMSIYQDRNSESVDRKKVKKNKKLKLDSQFWTEQRKPPLPSRIGDAVSQKSTCQTYKSDKNNTQVLSRISDEVNTTFKLKQFCMNRMSTVDLFKVMSDQMVDSDSQGSDYFSKQHPSLMTPPTPDCNDDQMFKRDPELRYTSTPLYRY
ncbi:hypothetical protein Btru_006171 [Bulinus truncatus]|nr:hypothetical protein Btru_006171 [Bulinus truncatus]